MYVRQAGTSDILSVKNCDLKCYYDSYTNAQWDGVTDDYAVNVAICKGTVVGYVLFCQDRENTNLVLIRRLGVLPSFRRRGVGRRLYDSVHDVAKLLSVVHIATTIPEHMCDPRTPFDCTPFLLKLGFQAKMPVAEGLFTYLGEPEAGIVFLAEVNNEN